MGAALNGMAEETGGKSRWKADGSATAKYFFPSDTSDIVWRAM
jgi:hypothetical protein